MGYLSMGYLNKQKNRVSQSSLKNTTFCPISAISATHAGRRSGASWP